MHQFTVVRPEDSVRGLQSECRVTCDNQMTDSGTEAVLSGWKASMAAKSMADKSRKCL